LLKGKREKLLIKIPYKVVDYYSMGVFNFLVFEEELIYLENLDNFLKGYDLFIFLSRHESASKFKTLSAHVPGNWVEAKYGGKSRSVCIAPANVLTNILKRVYEYHEKMTSKGWKITFEVTHHGPSIQSTPVVFVEIGSSIGEWRDDEAGTVIAEATLKGLRDKWRKEVAVGLGGPHYAPSFNRAILEKDYNIAIGHIIPGYHFDDIGPNEVKTAINRTLEKVTIALVDKKGLKKRHKKWLIPFLEETELEILYV